MPSRRNGKQGPQQTAQPQPVAADAAVDEDQKLMEASLLALMDPVSDPGFGSLGIEAILAPTTAEAAAIPVPRKYSAVQQRRGAKAKPPPPAPASKAAGAPPAGAPVPAPPSKASVNPAPPKASVNPAPPKASVNPAPPKAPVNPPPPKAPVNPAPPKAVPVAAAPAPKPTPTPAKPMVAPRAYRGGGHRGPLPAEDEFKAELTRARIALREKNKFVLVSALARHMLETFELNRYELANYASWNAAEKLLRTVDTYIEAACISSMLVTFHEVRAAVGEISVIRKNGTLDDFEQLWGKLLHHPTIVAFFKIPKSVLEKNEFPIRVSRLQLVPALLQRFEGRHKFTDDDEIAPAIEACVQQYVQEHELTDVMAAHLAADKSRTVTTAYAGVRVNDRKMLSYIMTISSRLSDTMEREVKQELARSSKAELKQLLLSQNSDTLDKALQQGRGWIKAWRATRRQGDRAAVLAVAFLQACDEALAGRDRSNVLKVLAPLAALAVSDTRLDEHLLAANARSVSREGQIAIAQDLTRTAMDQPLHPDLPPAQAAWNLLEVLDEQQRQLMPLNCSFFELLQTLPTLVAASVRTAVLNRLAALLQQHRATAQVVAATAVSAPRRTNSHVLEEVMHCANIIIEDVKSQRERAQTQKTGLGLFLHVLAKIEENMADEAAEAAWPGEFTGQTFLDFLNKYGLPLLELVEPTLQLAPASSETSYSAHARASQKAAVCATAVRMLQRFSLLDEPIEDNAMHAVIERTLLAQYQVHTIQDLGFDSIQALLQQAQASSSLDAQPMHAALEVVAVPTARVPAVFQERCNAVAAPFANHQQCAVQAIRNAPLLVDLRVCTHWDLLFLPALGSFTTFLQEQASQLSDLIIIETPDARHLRLPVIPTDVRERDACIRQALQAQDGRCLAASLLGALHNTANMPDSIFQALDQELRTFIASALDAAAGVLVDALAALPPCFLPTVGVALCTPAMKWLPGWEQNMWHTATVPARCALQAVGILMNIPSWRVGLFSPAESAPTIAARTVRPPAPEQSDPSEPSPTANLHEPIVDVLPVAPVTLVAPADAPSQASSLTEAGHSDMCVELCNRIARQEFGLFVPEQSEAVQRLRQKTQGAVERLAAELYSKNLHFVLELLQNADDNAYAPGVVPKLAIDLDSSQLVFTNNELGFSEANVLALSSVNSSTKKAGGAGRYIGNKGIGFKSVFMVTTSPAIHSGPYHFQFSSNDPDMRYILPRSVPVPHDWSNAVGTRIVLPLDLDQGSSGAKGTIVSQTPASASHRAMKLSVELEDLRPELLLFLPKLRILEIRDQIKGQHRLIRREDLPCDLQLIHTDDESPVRVKRVMLQETVRQPPLPDRTTQTHWWLFSRTIAMPVASQDGTDISTEVVVGFRDLEQPPVAANVSLTPCDVFAFLPLRDYGLKFMVQADFEVPAARESIDEKKRWNEYILAEIPRLLAAAAQILVDNAGSSSESKSDSDDPDTASVDRVCNLLRALPAPGQAMEAFKRLPASAAQLLRAVYCIPAQGQFRPPKDTVFWPQSSAAWSDESSHQRVTTTIQLLQNKGLWLADPIVASVLHPDVAKLLGLRVMNADLLLELLQHSCSEHPATSLDLDWAVWVLRQCMEELEPSALRRRLHDIPFVPLADGRMHRVSHAAGQRVFLALDSKIDLRLPDTSVALNIVDPRFCAAFAGQSKRFLDELHTLGVEDVKSVSFVENGLLPHLHADEASPQACVRLLTIAHKVLIACGKNTVEHLVLHAQQHPIRVLLNDDTTMFTPLEGVHVWPADGPLSRVISASESKWRSVAKYDPPHVFNELFVKLGATTGIYMPPVRYQLQLTLVDSQLQQVFNTDPSAAPELQGWLELMLQDPLERFLTEDPAGCVGAPRLTLVATVNDVSPVELLQVLRFHQSLPTMDSHRTALCEYLSTLVQQGQLRPHATVSIGRDGESPSLQRSVSSLVQRVLQASAWVPCTDGLRPPSTMVPTKVLFPTPGMLRFIAGAHGQPHVVGLLTPACPLHMSLAQFIGMEMELTPQHIFDALQCVAAHLLDQPHKPHEDMLWPYYFCLARMLGEKVLKSDDLPSHLVYIPKVGMVPVQDCIQRDPTGFLSSHCRVLSAHYSERCLPKLGDLGVPEGPTESIYIAYLRTLIISAEHSRRQAAWRVLQALWRIRPQAKSALLPSQLVGTSRKRPSPELLQFVQRLKDQHLVLPALDDTFLEYGDAQQTPTAFFYDRATKIEGFVIPPAIMRQVVALPPKDDDACDELTELLTALGLQELTVSFTVDGADGSYMPGLSNSMSVHLFAYALQHVVEQVNMNQAVPTVDESAVKKLMESLFVMLRRDLRKTPRILGEALQPVPIETHLEVKQHPVLYVVSRPIPAPRVESTLPPGLRGLDDEALTSEKSTAECIHKGLWELVTDADMAATFVQVLTESQVAPDAAHYIRQHMGVALRRVTHADLERAFEVAVRAQPTAQSLPPHVATQVLEATGITTASRYWFADSGLPVRTLCAHLWRMDLLRPEAPPMVEDDTDEKLDTAGIDISGEMDNPLMDAMEAKAQLQQAQMAAARAAAGPQPPSSGGITGASGPRVLLTEQQAAGADYAQRAEPHRKLLQSAGAVFGAPARTLEVSENIGAFPDESDAAPESAAARDSVDTSHSHHAHPPRHHDGRDEDSSQELEVKDQDPRPYPRNSALVFEGGEGGGAVALQWQDLDAALLGDGSLMADDMANLELGRWGELVAFKLFQKLYPDKAVSWLNERGESGHPCDLIMNQGVGQLAVEVKTTTQEAIARAAGTFLAHFSSNELNFAQTHPYMLVCVVRTDGIPVVSCVHDFAQNLSAGRIPVGIRFKAPES